MDPFTSLTDGVVATWNREQPTYADQYLEFERDWPGIGYRTRRCDTWVSRLSSKPASPSSS